MRQRRIITAGLAAALTIAAVPIAQASRDDRQTGSRDKRPAATRHFHGKVSSVNRARHTFRIRRTKGSRVLVKVTSRTRFEHIAGFSALRRGHAVEVRARRSHGRWVARKVERRSTDRPGNGSRDDSRDDRRDDSPDHGDDSPSHPER